MKILREVNRPDPNLDEIERLIKGDVSFSYKLIKCINSAFFGLRCKVSSIKHALILLGMREVRSWVSLLALQGLGEDKPTELVELSIIRGRFAELLAEKVDMPERASDLFLLGLFSLIDAIIDKPMTELLDELPLNDDIKSALMSREGPLADIYDLVVANERGEWDKFPELAQKIGFDELEIPSLFVDALEWTQEIMHI
jgi:EAL and modified HD-GYP domain-containing signal transduction protein